MKPIDDVLNHEPLNGGFGTVDDKGRISLSKPVRSALGIEEGSAVAFLVLDGALLIVPQDAHLATLQLQALRALTAAGLTTRDLLDELPEARAEIAREAYGAEFLREMERLRAETPAE